VLCKQNRFPFGTPDSCLFDKHVYCVYTVRMTSREIVRHLTQDGWVLVHVRGSHHQYKHPDKPGRVTVPHPKRDLPIGTVRSIYKQAGWEWPDR
jgi:predicted RNA binding protein YcfA (HicA-like mRNA interferase family)